MAIEPSKYEVHPAANLFPLMSPDEYAGLKADIEENGQREDIVVWKGQLIDGRNRLRACEELGRNPSIAELDEDQDPLKYVISHNPHRRHLTTSQRSDVAAKLATMKQGARTDLGSKDTKSIDEAAKEMTVSPAGVKRAKKVHAKGSDATKKALSDGSLKVTTAAAFVDAVPDKAEQAAIVAKGPEAVKEAATVPKRVKRPRLGKIEFMSARLEEMIGETEEELTPEDWLNEAQFAKELLANCEALTVLVRKALKLAAVPK